ncbi:MAG: methyl-accepting chemotaxis protein [Desulfovibrionaceae bacterium]
MKLGLHLKVRGKLLLPILTVVILGIAAIQVFTYTKSADLMEAEISGGVKAKAHGAAGSLDEWLQRSKLDLANWAKNPDFANLLNEQPFAYEQAVRDLSGKHKDYAFLSALYVVDATGKAVADAEGGRQDLNVGDREYFRTAMRGEPNISEPVISKVTGKPVFIVAAPVADGTGKVLGALVGVVELDYLTKAFISSIEVGDNGYAFVSNGKGLIIAHPNPDFILKLDISDSDFGKVMLNERNGTYKYWFDKQNQWKLMGFSEVGSTGWLVAVTAPLDELLAPLVTVRNFSMLGGLITVIIAAFVILFFVGRITKTLSSAVSHLQELSVGNVDRDVPLELLAGTDEMGDLARGLETMVKAQRQRAELAQAIAEGDLTRSVSVSSEKDRLGRALETMVHSLNDIISQIGAAAEQVQDGSGQVSESSQALSQGATEQASSLEEITSSVTEISSQTRINAENASQASRLASEARDSADGGNREMQNMVKAMSEINDSSQAISKIIKVIDEIAFQTNLLALNAAVEAARAGRHGKGFAVVAEEVRNLASRSAKAAQETAELIEGSVATVTKGAEIASQTSESLEQIVSRAGKLADLVADIAAASDEQAKGVGQINQGLGQIDQVTQQNTANAEETASASEELSSQAVEMRRLVGRFRLSDKAGGRQLPPSASRALSGGEPRRPSAALPGSKPQSKPQSKSQPNRPAQDAWSAPRSAGGSDTVTPEDIISLDGDEFGRY